MKYLLHIVIFIGSLCLHAQLSPQTKGITETFFPDSEEILNTTPALLKKRGFTDYEELMTFLNSLIDSHPETATVTFIGESQKGRQIPMVKLSKPNGNDKIKVWMQGGLHGNEPASTESMLYLLDRLLNDNSYGDLLDGIDLAVVPMANIDGYLKQDRYAANGLDLNRDQTKLMAAESVVLKRAFSEFNPEVAVDFHEYRPYRRDYAKFSDFGVTGLYDAMFLYSGNLNVPEGLRLLTESLFVRNAQQRLDAYNYRHHPYISSTTVKSDIQINQGSISARSSATNYALSNTISSLIEIRGVGLGKTSFKRRIHASFLIAISYLKTASENKALIKNEIVKATNEAKHIAVKSKRATYKDTIEFIDLDSEKIIGLELTVNDALKASTTLERPRPLAYIIEAEQIEIIEKLKILGAEMEFVNEDKTMNVEVFVISSYDRNTVKYEKMNQQTVSVNLETKQKTIKKGSVLVPMNQRRANIIAEVLEPEIPNSFVSFGILETNLGAELPIYRLLKQEE